MLLDKVCNLMLYIFFAAIIFGLWVMLRKIDIDLGNVVAFVVFGWQIGSLSRRLASLFIPTHFGQKKD